MLVDACVFYGYAEHSSCVLQRLKNIRRSRQKVSTMAGERLTVGFLDFSDESSNASVHVGTITAVNLAAVLVDIAAFIAAIDAITLGTIRDDTLVAYSTNRSSIPPVDANAQRERKWLVRYTDVTPFFDDPINAIPNAGFGKIFTMAIPTAALGLVGVMIPNTDLADLTVAPMPAFVTAFEELARSPYGGLVQILDISAVGRNL